MTIRFGNMNCRQCVNAVADLLSELPGISKVVINLDEKEVELECNGNVEREIIIRTLSYNGYWIEKW